jgi:hypothetical protein
MSDCFSTHYLQTTAKKACTPYVRAVLPFTAVAQLPETLPVNSVLIEGFAMDALSVQTVSGAHLPAYSTGTVALSAEVEQPGCVVDHSPPSGTEVKNEWSCTSAPHCRPIHSWRVQGQFYLYLYLCGKIIGE